MTEEELKYKLDKLKNTRTGMKWFFDNHADQDQINRLGPWIMEIQKEIDNLK